MRLAPGARLGPYEIVAPLGAGGMGEVYKARDSRLDRTVAIKILSVQTSSSPDALLRFEREARTISQLSHPHICALFDVGRHGDTDYLVMEMLEGDTLSTRLAAGALPLDLTLRYGVQIADALDKAHRQGIVHRDLKPANVMITKTGVKLLDFGLATRAASLHAETAAVETVAASRAIAGTVQYMAPEVLAGQPADTRSDIYGLGAVLYEMATGAKAFRSSGEAVTPAALDLIVRSCLAVDPDERWQSAHDVSVQLRSIGQSRQLQAVTVPAGRRWRSLLPWVVAAAALLAATGVALRRPGPAVAATPATPVRFAMPPPPGHIFFQFVEGINVAVSPDGSRIAFSAIDPAAGRRIWLRSAGDLDPVMVGGTEDAAFPFWSPDGKAIAFFTGSKLRRVDLRNSSPVTICDVREGIGWYGTWGAEGRILFSSVEGDAIFAVPASGGTPEPLLKRDLARGEARLNWPFFLPDGRSFLYLARKGASGTLMLARPDVPPREIMPLQSPAQYVDPGYLVFATEGALLARRFDVATGQLSGEAFPVARPVSYFLSTSVAEFSASRTGTIAYQGHLNQSSLVWFDRSGRELATIGAAGDYKNPRFSPDGRRLLFDRLLGGAYDVWQTDLERQAETRLTLGASSEGAGPWMPDGKSFFFNADVGKPPDIFRKSLATGADTPLLAPGSTFREPQDVSPDGRWLLYTERGAGGNHIWLTPTDGSGAPSVVFKTAFEEDDVRFSPDGRSFSFTSNAEGGYEVYVSAFPPGGEKIRVSTTGGQVARWSRDGRELFFLSGPQVMAVPVRTSPSLSVGTPVRLFASEPARRWGGFDVAPDGRFLAVVRMTRAWEQPLTVVVNWPAYLDR